MPADADRQGIAMTTNPHQPTVPFNWLEFYELYCLLVCYGTPEEIADQLQELLDRSEEEQSSRIFMLEPVLQEQGTGVLLRGDVLARLTSRLEARLHAPRDANGETPDDDQLEVLLPLLEKLRMSSSPEGLYLVA
jgi:hypothetical protein